MKNYFKKIETKLKEQFKFEELKIIDNTQLHTKHKSYIPGKLHLHIKIKSEYLKSISRINAQRIIMKALKKDLNTNIHALEISINK
tara:strand:+ start:136 stop:393 length:258 start_codon:yes stop_codon:yes gene_type:complete